MSISLDSKAPGRNPKLGNRKPETEVPNPKPEPFRPPMDLSNPAGQTGAAAEQYIASLLQLLGEMEVYLASLAFKDAAEQRGLRVCLPELVGTGAVLPAFFSSAVSSGA